MGEVNSYKDMVLEEARRRIKEIEAQVETAKELIRRMRMAGEDVSKQEMELRIQEERLRKLKEAFK